MILFGSATKHTSGSVDMSIAITLSTGMQIPQTRLFRVPCTLWNSRPGWPSQTCNNRTVLIWKRTQGGSHCHRKHYTDVLNKFWRPLGTRHGVNRDVQWLQQDGATSHIANTTMEWLDHRFPNRPISRCREWFPYSPDLNTLDSYLWWFLKDNVYENNPPSNAELKVPTW